MLFVKLSLLLPLAAAQLSSSGPFRGKKVDRGTEACKDLCRSIPGCFHKGSFCKSPPNPKHPRLCQDLHFDPVKHSANATACTVFNNEKNCPKDRPVRCDDIQPFEPGHPKFPLEAEAELKPFRSKSGVSGRVRLTQEDFDKTRISYHISGLKPHSVHGFHIHDKADFSHGCSSIGGHYNPFQNLHGGRFSTIRHVGDMGNVRADRNGVARGHFYSDLIVVSGPTSVLHRAVAVDLREDDLHPKGDGNSGPALSCGKIVEYKH
ncbi:Superoxide dismutase [Cu-Zn] [Perkinsus olseni]|uniref:Superoxide dismutase [Cu-Zn] n=1 Tax=Perkinsus olseni TaxID=32597 RepID=A0A7J6P3B1_PEROL|nr:Superoxide dismutase [Cu-Zn] [Perkinsus olseni]